MKELWLLEVLLLFLVVVEVKLVLCSFFEGGGGDLGKIGERDVGRRLVGWCLLSLVLSSQLALSINLGDFKADKFFELEVAFELKEEFKNDWL